ncbi:MAG TPA: hypothetical protein VFA45_02120 [Actinomycetes bacterium]|jgi:hypothetical protein|nr:hypothetical protein [Actinomycetes bacterium]
MRPRRCLVVLAALAVLAVASVSTASAQMSLSLRDVDCSGVTVNGAGLPPSARVTLTLTSLQRRTLARQSLTTSLSGSFTWSARLSLSGLRSVRAVVTRASASTPIAWAEHSVPRPCPLVNTGADHAGPLAGLALSSIVLGFLLLTASSHKIRLGRYQGRHVAAR